MRVGVVGHHQDAWPGITTYTRMLLRSLTEAGLREDSLFLLAAAEPPRDFIDGVRATVIDTRPAWVERIPPAGRKVVRASQSLLARSGLHSNMFLAARNAGISVMLPLPRIPVFHGDTATLGWIPDFQHRDLPDLFSPAERKARDHRYGQLAERASLVLLSSEHARSRFEHFAPSRSSKARVLGFPSLFAFDPPPGPPQLTAEKYRIPPRFALVINQFWIHKNHLAVVDAMAVARAAGVDVPVVFVGTPSDYRDPVNRVVTDVMLAISRNGLRDLAIVLGQVPRSELVDLLRSCSVVIQPSRYEGWSTTVQDALAVGKPVICSDLAVHREQAPAAVGFFPAEDPDALGRLLARTWNTLHEGHDAEAERVALTAERARGAEHGARLLALCREAVARVSR